MKHPKVKKAYCKTCKKHTEHKVAQVKAKGRSATHPLSWGSAKRRKAKTGAGNHGKYSKPAIAKFKRTGAKTSKKAELDSFIKIILWIVFFGIALLALYFLIKRIGAA